MKESSQLAQCAGLCYDCVESASRCADWCLRSDRVEELAECVRVCLATVDIATACARITSRTSRFTGKVCESCATECEKHRDLDALFGDCAATCRQAARMCRDIARAPRVPTR